jgi:hypothetical protein
MNFRLIAKGLFLLVFIGFFMPMCCDMNGLQLAGRGYVSSDGVFAIYAIFVSSIIGLIIGALLLLKQPVPISIDWIVTIFCFLCTVIAFYISGIANENIDDFQSGVYVILTGAILVMIAQIVSAVMAENTNKKCPFCANDIKKEAGFCQFCGKELPKETIIDNTENNIKGEYFFTESDFIREGPGDHYPFVYRFKKDEIVERKQIDGDWTLVRRGDIEGWCLSSILKTYKPIIPFGVLARKIGNTIEKKLEAKINVPSVQMK